MQVLDGASIRTQLSSWLQAWKVQNIEAQYDGIQDKESDSEWTEVSVIALILLHLFLDLHKTCTQSLWLWADVAVSEKNLSICCTL